VEEFVARENIRRFETQLRASSDERQKAVLRGLLAAEQRRLDEVRSHKIAD